MRHCGLCSRLLLYFLICCYFARQTWSEYGKTQRKMSLSQKCSWREFGLFDSQFTFCLIIVFFVSGSLAALTRAGDIKNPEFRQASTNFAAELRFKNELELQKKLHGDGSVQVAQTLQEYGVFLVSSTQYTSA